MPVNRSEQQSPKGIDEISQERSEADTTLHTMIQLQLCSLCSLQDPSCFLPLCFISLTAILLKEANRKEKLKIIQSF